MKTLNVFSILLISSLSFSAQADTTYVDGYVERVEPMYKTVRVSNPSKECWEEPITSYREVPSGGADTGMSQRTGTILGGIVGAGVGNQFGKGKGKDAMTVAGAVLGGSLGYDLSGDSPQNRTERVTRYETRCKTVNNYREEERFDRNRVYYEMNGYTGSFTTKKRYRVGDVVRLKITITPDI